MANKPLLHTYKRDWSAVIGVVATACLVATFPLCPSIGSPHHDPKFQRITRYTDNLDFVIDRAIETQFSPIGELESVETSKDKAGNSGRYYGTGVLISPCYVLTSHHVAFQGDADPKPGYDYSMKFRVGVSRNADTAFLGNTIAVPVIWGRIGAVFANDWAILELRSCVGSRPDIGWFEASDRQVQDLVGTTILSLGYAGDKPRGTLSGSVGRSVSISPSNGLVNHSASYAPGQSGGPVLTMEQGQMRLIGLNTNEFVDHEDGGRRMFPTFTNRIANQYFPVVEILRRADVAKLLQEDKDRYGRNPASERLTRPFPRGTT